MLQSGHSTNQRSEQVNVDAPQFHVVPYVTGGFRKLLSMIKKDSIPDLPDYGFHTNSEGHFDPKGSCIMGLRYTVKKVLDAKGQSAVLVLAQDEFSHKPVVIKVLHSHLYELGDQEGHVLRKLAKADPLNLSHTLRLLTTLSYDSHYCLVFEPLLPDSLTDVFSTIPSNRILTNVRHVGLRLLASVGFLQQQNLIHTDLKPDNILLKRENDLDSVHIVDFGNAIHYVHSEISLYYKDFELQTPLYRAPEVMFGVPFGPEIDMWSLGCILAELVIGKPLFFGTTKEEIMEKVTDILGPFPVTLFRHGKYYKCLRRFTSDVDQANCTIKLMEHIQCKDLVFADLIAGLLVYDPEERLSAWDAARHAFFASHLPLAFLLPKNTGQSSYPAVNLTKEAYSHTPHIASDIRRQPLAGADLLRQGTTELPNLDDTAVVKPSPRLGRFHASNSSHSADNSIQNKETLPNRNRFSDVSVVRNIVVETDRGNYSENIKGKMSSLLQAIRDEQICVEEDLHRRDDNDGGNGANRNTNDGVDKPVNLQRDAILSRPCPRYGRLIGIQESRHEQRSQAASWNGEINSTAESKVLCDDNMLSMATSGVNPDSNRRNQEKLNRNIDRKTTQEKLNRNIDGKRTHEKLDRNIDGKTTQEKLDRNIDGKATQEKLNRNIDGKATQEKLDRNIDGKTRSRMLKQENEQLSRRDGPESSSRCEDNKTTTGARPTVSGWRPTHANRSSGSSSTFHKLNNTGRGGKSVASSSVVSTQIGQHSMNSSNSGIIKSMSRDSSFMSGSNQDCSRSSGDIIELGIHKSRKEFYCSSSESDGDCLESSGYSNHTKSILENKLWEQIRMKRRGNRSQNLHKGESMRDFDSYTTSRSYTYSNVPSGSKENTVDFLSPTGFSKKGVVCDKRPGITASLGSCSRDAEGSISDKFVSPGSSTKNRDNGTVRSNQVMTPSLFRRKRLISESASDDEEYLDLLSPVLAKSNEKKLKYENTDNIYSKNAHDGWSKDKKQTEEKLILTGFCKGPSPGQATPLYPPRIKTDAVNYSTHTKDFTARVSQRHVVHERNCQVIFSKMKDESKKGSSLDNLDLTTSSRGSRKYQKEENLSDSPEIVYKEMKRFGGLSKMQHDSRDSNSKHNEELLKNRLPSSTSNITGEFKMKTENRRWGKHRSNTGLKSGNKTNLERMKHFERKNSFDNVKQSSEASDGLHTYSFKGTPDTDVKQLTSKGGYAHRIAQISRKRKKARKSLEFSPRQIIDHEYMESDDDSDSSVDSGDELLPGRLEGQHDGARFLHTNLLYSQRSLESPNTPNILNHRNISHQAHYKRKLSPEKQSISQNKQRRKSLKKETVGAQNFQKALQSGKEFDSTFTIDFESPLRNNKADCRNMQ